MSAISDPTPDPKRVERAKQEDMAAYLTERGWMTVAPDAQETEPTIFDLFRRVQQHPDFVFGTIFVPGDFPNEQVPEDFPHNLANDALAERGNELIAEMEET